MPTVGIWRRPLPTAYVIQMIARSAAAEEALGITQDAGNTRVVSLLKYTRRDSIIPTFIGEQNYKAAY